MNCTFKGHLIPYKSFLTQALEQLSFLREDAILFLIDDNDKLIGSLTDGDVRRGILKGVPIDSLVDEFAQLNPRYIRKNQFDIHEIIKLRNANYKIIPVIDKEDKIVNIINFRFLKSYLPIDAIIMAGGKGARLKPLTDTVPKPLLKVGGKAIIEYNLDRLISFGIDDFWISVNYLGEQLRLHIEQQEYKNIRTSFLFETKPLGTIGAASFVEEFMHQYVLITNSDILTNLDYEDFFLSFLESGADMSVVTIPYKVDIPYAVFEMNDDRVLTFKEKPTYTYHSNGGIYLFKKDVLKQIPKNEFFDATDLIDLLIRNKQKIHSYPLRSYWLDIGKPEDFKKAQEDVMHINF